MTEPKEDSTAGVKEQSLSLLFSYKKMSNLVPAYSIAELYRSVVEDVVGRVRSEFVGEGVDE